MILGMFTYVFRSNLTSEENSESLFTFQGLLNTSDGKGSTVSDPNFSWTLILYTTSRIV